MLVVIRELFDYSFVVGGCAWGVQFHPESDAEIVRAYIRHHRTDLVGEGWDVGHLLEGCYDTPWSSEILRRFVEIVQRKRAGQQLGQRQVPGVIGPERRLGNESERLRAL